MEIKEDDSRKEANILSDTNVPPAQQTAARLQEAGTHLIAATSDLLLV